MAKAETLMQRVLSRLNSHVFEWNSERIKVEISCGIATSGELTNEQSEKELISKADARLYDVKRPQHLMYPVAKEE
ncbi:MAG: diguanylate cyclase [Proteobacteria bacterium]|nr:diguanylate cyclase [Pseudomonadota bacterium]